mgnify:CR=1 FL=1
MRHTFTTLPSGRSGIADIIGHASIDPVGFQVSRRRGHAPPGHDQVATIRRIPRDGHHDVGRYNRLFRRLRAGGIAMVVRR